MERPPEAYTRGILAAVLEPWIDGLSQVNAALQSNRKFRSSLYDPDLDTSTKLEATEGILPQGAPVEVRNFLGVLLENNDIGLLDEILDSLDNMIRAKVAGPQRAIVTSAVVLSDAEQDKLRERLAKDFGPLELSFQVEPEILGGIIVRVGDRLIDDSVRGRLDALRNALGVRAA
ncbi:MAG: ATP synthase F1 subunit delta [Caldilineales bacterium]|nr:ATP synthase F1 subunit delta [Caldilineales bacterium]